MTRMVGDWSMCDLPTTVRLTAGDQRLPLANNLIMQRPPPSTRALHRATIAVRRIAPYAGAVR
jgi:hypothetical protein